MRHRRSRRNTRCCPWGSSSGDVETPHLTVPSSGSSSPMRILNMRRSAATSFSPTKAILSAAVDGERDLVQQLHAVDGLRRRPSTVRMSLPSSRSMREPDIRDSGGRKQGISSTLSLSSRRRRAVACLLLALLAEKRWMKACSSSIFSSIALVLVANQALHELARLIPEVVVADVHA